MIENKKPLPTLKDREGITKSKGVSSDRKYEKSKKWVQLYKEHLKHKKPTGDILQGGGAELRGGGRAVMKKGGRAK